jgi:hypothetical protein
MPIGDAQLKTWSKHGSVAQSRDTYAAIKNVLENQDAPYSNKDFTVFLQGSYGNETNVYAESDVDIVMELQSTFYRDLARLSDLDRDAYENAFSNATYNHSDFKKDAVTWLTKGTGKQLNRGPRRYSWKRMETDAMRTCLWRRNSAVTINSRLYRISGLRKASASFSRTARWSKTSQNNTPGTARISIRRRVVGSNRRCASSRIYGIA